MLFVAAHGNIDLNASTDPIRTLLEQGCDLEADILPVVAREVPELPRPLKNWGAPWLVRDILAGREQRLAGHRVEAAPPARRTPAIEWDEFVGGYRAGLFQWNRPASLSRQFRPLGQHRADPRPPRPGLRPRSGRAAGGGSPAPRPAAPAQKMGPAVAVRAYRRSAGKSSDQR
jgi:hypothetical protein